MNRPQMLDDTALRRVAKTYGLGDYQGTRDNGLEGVVTFATSQSDYALTVFDAGDEQAAAYVGALTRFLAAREVATPSPVTDPDGRTLGVAGDKPMMVTPCPPGGVTRAPTGEQCAALGAALGTLHAVGQAFDETRSAPRDDKWWRGRAHALRETLDTDAAVLLDNELHFQGLFRFQDLPRGAVHGRPIRARVLVADANVTGLMNLRDACTDTLLSDVAIAVNDWCSRADGTLESEHARALLGAYHRRRPLTAIERGAWPVMLRNTALRAWLDHLPTGHGEPYRAILAERATRQNELQHLWP